MDLNFAAIRIIFNVIDHHIQVLNIPVWEGKTVIIENKPLKGRG
jgi:hypothetical protein